MQEEEEEPPEEAKEAIDEDIRSCEVPRSSKFVESKRVAERLPAQQKMTSDEPGRAVAGGVSKRVAPAVPSLPPPVPPPRTIHRKVTELRCCEVRWFYRRKEIDPKWTPFKGADSLRMELRFRLDHKMEIDPQPEGKLDEMGDEVVVLDGLYKMADDHSKIVAVYWKDDEAEIRRGSWFLDWQHPLEHALAMKIEELHLEKFRGQTIPNEASMYSEKEASRKPQLAELTLPENLEVKWSSVVDVFLCSTTKTGRLLRYMTWGKDTKLRRGYESEAEWSDGSPPISHLILVVHGIGQKGYENLIAKNTEQIRDGVNMVLERVHPDIKSRPMLLPVEWRCSLVLDGGKTDTITLPKMSAMRTTLNSTAMDIMYYQSPLYRKEIVGGVVRAINQVYTLFKKHNPSFDGPISIFAHSLGSVITYDIITHWSPLLLYDDYVAKAIREQLEQNEGEDSSAASSMRAFSENREKLQREITGGFRCFIQAREEQLLFPVTNLFCVGSPLGVFLVMRGAEEESVLPSPDLLGRIFNIFHPYDPVAYRLEPLFAKEYRDIRTVKIFSWSDPRAKGDYDGLPPDVVKSYLKKQKQAATRDKKLQKNVKNPEDGESGEKKGKGEQPAMEEVDDEEVDCDSDDSASNVRSACSSPRSLSPPREEKYKKEKSGGGWWFKSSTSNGKKEASANAELAKKVKPEKELTAAEKILQAVPEEKRPPRRIDFNVHPALTDKSYWSVLKSHFSYWTNPDLAMFLVNVIYSPNPTAQPPWPQLLSKQSSVAPPTTTLSSPQTFPPRSHKDLSSPAPEAPSPCPEKPPHALELLQECEKGPSDDIAAEGDLGAPSPAF